MDLLIDIGNTTLKWVTSEAGNLSVMRSARHHDALPIDLHAAWEQLPSPGRVLVASVAAQSVTAALARTCRARWGLEPELAHTRRSSCGVTIAYEEPQRLGVDRWLALLAAHRSCAQPALIVDAGTAVTYDLLLSNGHHLGGLILPGIEMMRNELLSRTRIPQVEPVDIDGYWAADTATAVAAGSIQAPSALAERLLGRLSETAGAEPALLITGGDAERLLPALTVSARHEPDLVLQGLALLLS